MSGDFISAVCERGAGFLHLRGGDAVAEKKTGEVRQENAREIIEVKAAGAPVVLQHLAELVIAKETDNGEEQIIALNVEQVREYIGEQPPDLPLQNLA